MANLFNKAKKTIKTFREQHPVASNVINTTVPTVLRVGVPVASYQIGKSVWNSAKNNKSNAKTKVSTDIQDYNYQDIYDNLLAGGSGGSSGGGAYKPDVSALLDAYNQQNEAANQTAKTNYDRQLEKIKSDTLALTDDVINKQMKVVQEIASLLGETTAETKAAIYNLKKTFKGDE